jgi:hypothetical protein
LVVLVLVVLDYAQPSRAQGFSMLAVVEVVAVMVKHLQLLVLVD